MRFYHLIVSLLLIMFSSHVHAEPSATNCIKMFNDAQFSKAIKACQQAAEQGDAASQSVLGEMYDAGNGLPVSPKMAEKWWVLAAEQSYLPAQNLLALKYYYGGDVFQKQAHWEQDFEKAFKIWTQSAIKSEVTSQFMLGEMYMNGQGVPADYAESYAWFQIALEGGYKLATDSLIELSRVISPSQKQMGLERIAHLKKTIRNH